MEKVDVGGVQLACEEMGQGTETVVLSHSYLVDHHHFDPQIEALKARYRVIAYDHRDHGASDASPSSYDLATLVADAERVIEATNAGPCHFIGLSTGGFVGMRLALRRPDLFRSLVLMDTSAEAEPLVKRLEYQALFALLRLVGLRPLGTTATRKMFGPSGMLAPARAAELELWKERMIANDPRALVRFGNAIFDRDDVSKELARLRIPTLVVVGEEDGPQPPARARHLASAIPGAELAIIPNAGHLSTLDNPAAVNDVLLGFLDKVSSSAAS